MSYKNIEVSFENGLATLTLNRPPVNVLNIEMMEEINDALGSWLNEKDLKVLLINAKGKCFSAGVDVGEHMGDMAPKMIKVFHEMFRIMNRYESPIAASVYSSCLGGGCELAMFCDLVISADDAKWGQPEIQVGVFPPIAAQSMPRIMGRKSAMDLILSGRIISAEDARQVGLVNQVVKRDELETATSDFLKPYLKLSAEVLRKTKKAIIAGLRDDFESSLKIIEDIYLNELMKTADAQEGLSAFMEKRKANWTNK